MAYVNLPVSLSGMFDDLNERLSRVETGYSGPQATADSALANAGTAAATASTALANAATAYSAAIGSLQPSVNTIVNASNQMTAIAANGITVYAGSSSTTGARVVLNSQGLAAFDASNNGTFSLYASTGAATFKGDIIGGTLNIAGKFVVDATGLLTATGATIAGAFSTTNITTGAQLTIPASSNTINFYPATRTNFANPAYITTGGSDVSSYLYLFPATYTTQNSALTPYLILNASTTDSANSFLFYNAPIRTLTQAWSYTGTTGSATSGKIAYIQQDGTIINSGMGIYYSTSYGSSTPPSTLGDNGDWLFST